MQVLRDAHRAGRTEVARGSAADLARHAERRPAGGDAEDHRFDEHPGAGAEEELRRAILLRVVATVEFESVQVNATGKLIADVGGEFGERVGVAAAVLQQSIAEPAQRLWIVPELLAEPVDGRRFVDA